MTTMAFTKRTARMALLLCACLGGPASAAPNQPSVDVHVREGRVTAEIAGASLLDAVSALARETGMAVEWRGGSDEAVSVSFQDLPLDDAVGRLLGSRSHLLVYARAEGVEHARRLVVMATDGDPSAVRRVLTPAGLAAGRDMDANLLGPGAEAMLADPDPRVRVQLLASIDELPPGDVRRHAVITRLMADADASIRHAAAEVARALDPLSP